MNKSKITKNQAFLPFAIFVAILIFNTIISGGTFLEMKIVDGHLYGRIIDIIRNGSKLMLLATGMTMVIATGGTDISVGSVMAISGAVACSIVSGAILPGLGGNVVAAIILALLAGVLCGIWNGILVAQIKIQPIVATLILMVAGRGIAQLITKGKIVTVSSDTYYFINGGYILGIPFPVYVVLFIVIITLLFTKRTAFGLFLEATGCNSAASKFAGINVGLIKLLVYAVSGTLAAGAGLIESAGIKGADCNNAGLMIEMDAILAVAIGGTSLNGGKFSIPASIFGALIIQSITTMVYALGVAPEITQVVKAILVVIICLSQSKEFKDTVIKIFRREKVVAGA
ncbi:simple sugar transport system permease protein [Mobilisporobacter senegalensis]|uniref:Simple sugar transport system permease protein n=1 Tax=Mobilisporobacter senegalensis TaxID=1329262 RepID=A0A3N1XLB6_9FIRM|nr:ABC transporter permease [Mobilisporobacter senegalensis]ROR27515.1 simple sugar transport system permease protein [Mobilisporobacter senegalensis]